MKSKPKVLAVTGISGSGKTPVCHFLSWELRLHYEAELSEALIYMGYLPGAKALPEFDRLLSKMEINRDDQLCSHLPGWIVETWHPGNIAHMRVRNYPHIKQYVKRVQDRLTQVDPLCLHIQGKVESSVERCENIEILGHKKSEYDPRDFLEKLVEAYDFAFKLLEIPVVRINAERKTLKTLENISLRHAKDFFGGLKWNYA